MKHHENDNRQGIDPAARARIQRAEREAAQQKKNQRAAEKRSR